MYVIYLPTKHQRALGTRSKVSVRSRSNWNLEMLVFVEGGKPENPEKNPRSGDENQQQTQPTGIKPGPHWWEASALTTAPSQADFAGVDDIITNLAKGRGHGIEQTHSLIFDYF